MGNSSINVTGLSGKCMTFKWCLSRTFNHHFEQKRNIINVQFNSFRCIWCLWFISNHFICINTQQFFSSKPNQKQLYLTNNAGTNCSDIYFVVVVVAVIIIIRQVYFSLIYCTILVLNEYYLYVFIRSWCVSVENNKYLIIDQIFYSLQFIVALFVRLK